MIKLVTSFTLLIIAGASVAGASVFVLSKPGTELIATEEPQPKSATVILQELQQTRILVAAIATTTVDQPMVQERMIDVPILGPKSIGQRTANLRTTARIPLQYNLQKSSVQGGAIAFPCLEAGLGELGVQDTRYGWSWFAPGSDAELNTAAQTEALKAAKAQTLASAEWRQKAQESARAFVQTFGEIEVQFSEVCHANQNQKAP